MAVSVHTTPSDLPSATTSLTSVRQVLPISLPRENGRLGRPTQVWLTIYAMYAQPLLYSSLVTNNTTGTFGQPV